MGHRALAAIIAVLVACLVGQSAAQDSGRRVALVIGNSDYLGLAPLSNPRTDAQLITQSLRRSGYTVVTGINLNRAQFVLKLREFGRAANGAASAVIYYSGHGIGYNDRQYVVPVDARMDSVVDIGVQAIDADLMLVASRGARVRVVAFDADRLNPFTRRLARAPGGQGVVQSPRDEGRPTVAEDDVILLYASEAGTVASDGQPGGGSPFARALAETLVEPGLEVRALGEKVIQLVRAATADMQRPEVISRIRANSYIIPPPATAIAPATISSQPRIALVVGASDYNRDGDILDTSVAAALENGGLTDLKNAGNDAEDIRDALRRLQFRDVTHLPNPTQSELSDAVLTFTRKARALGPDVIAVFFYAGHGIQVNGANFLIPTGARLPEDDIAQLTPRQAETLLRSRAFAVSEVIDNLPVPSGNGANIVILDACRNNPWDERLAGASRSSGGAGGLTSADVPDDLVSTLIAFSTAPNRTAADGDSGRNSPYTSALMKRIEQPGLPILLLFNEVSRDVRTATKTQQPWFSGAGVNPVCLGPCSPT
jgi:uncharacterized caspase-like protein